MELSLTYDPEKDILTIHVGGEYRRPHDGFAAQQFVINSFSEFKTRRILLDLTQAVIIPGTMPTFQTANPQPDIARELRKFSFAAVYPVITEDERFFETAAVNRGLRVRIFDSLKTAVDWLMQE